MQLTHQKKQLKTRVGVIQADQPPCHSFPGAMPLGATHKKEIAVGALISNTGACGRKWNHQALGLLSCISPSPVSGATMGAPGPRGAARRTLRTCPDTNPRHGTSRSCSERCGERGRGRRGRVRFRLPDPAALIVRTRSSRHRAGLPARTLCTPSRTGVSRRRGPRRPPSGRPSLRRPW